MTKVTKSPSDDPAAEAAIEQMTKDMNQQHFHLPPVKVIDSSNPNHKNPFPDSIRPRDRGERDRRRDRDRDRHSNRGVPTPVFNSRAALLGEAEAPDLSRRDRALSSSGAAGSSSTGTSSLTYRNFHRGGAGGGPPPVVNPRFAQLAEEEREKHNREKEAIREKRTSGDTGRNDTGGRFSSLNYSAHATGTGTGTGTSAPPPLQENSRFMRAIQQDQDYQAASAVNLTYKRHEETPSATAVPSPPLVVQNSRFAAAAAEMQLEREREMKEREERRSYMRGGGGDPPPPPPPLPTVNSRFSRAAADYAVEKEHENRERDELRARRQAEWEERQARRGEGNTTGASTGDRFGGARRMMEDHRRTGQGLSSRKEEEDVDAFPPLLGMNKTVFERPELPKHLQPKKAEEPILPAVDIPLALPGESEEEARARIEQKKRDEEERKLAEQKAAEEAKARKAAEEAAAAEAALKAAEVEGDLLAAFASGNKLGQDLQMWCEEQGVLLPSVEKLVHHLLLRTQKDHPDPNCAWAEPSQFGTALLSLVSDNVVKQTEILFGIQRFCYDIKFPRVNEEGLVQAMFRGMYKYDLAEPEAFDVWKEDESLEHNDGKGTAIIQTMDWFNWLEEDEEEDDEEEYEDEEY